MKNNHHWLDREILDPANGGQVVRMNEEFTHLLTSDEKLKHWGYGEWIEEPDMGTFSYKGFLCQIKRIMALEFNGTLFGGHWCGYIRIPEGHPWHGMNWESENQPDIHGGITYHEQEEDGFWIGFDCAHSGDVIPSMIVLRKELAAKDERFAKLKKERKQLMDKMNVCPLGKTYKNLAFVIGECKSLADQATLIIERK